VPKLPRKTLFFFEVSALFEVLFEVLFFGGNFFPSRKEHRHHIAIAAAALPPPPPLHCRHLRRRAAATTAAALSPLLPPPPPPPPPPQPPIIMDGEVAARAVLGNSDAYLSGVLFFRLLQDRGQTMSDEDMAKFEKKKRGRDHSLARGNSTPHIKIPFCHKGYFLVLFGAPA
jgi:hypothetical protein